MGVYRWTVTLGHHTTGPVLCTNDHVLRSEYKKKIEFTGTLVIISRVMLSAVTVVLLNNCHNTNMLYCL